MWCQHQNGIGALYFISNVSYNFVYNSNSFIVYTAKGCKTLHFGAAYDIMVMMKIVAMDLNTILTTFLTFLNYVHCNVWCDDDIVQQ